jgi:4-phospho-D-threonate 3-dehydrogenase / 4-phospho-D-erythronate 3-dehydrogenase
MTRPLLAITLGDPSGIGPEIILKALAHAEVFAACRPLVIGDARVLYRAAGWLGQHYPMFEMVAEPALGGYYPGTIPLLNLENADPYDCPPGEVCAPSGRAAAESVCKACDLALAGEVDGIVTPPLNKEAMNLAGFHYAGHTELLAERTGAKKVTMMLTSASSPPQGGGGALRVVHVSTHVSLEEAIRRVTSTRVGEVIDLAQAACLSLGIEKPRIAVAGLNPHASEEGLFGDQEMREILPAVQAARARGLVVSGPLPPDTVFLKANQGQFDIVVAMYHDQGHIPMKLLAFDSGVNVSLGLPVIRTSVDHGTAFDIAGTGRASENSLLAAIEVAVQMAKAK